MQKPNRPRDTNQLAKSIVDIATEQNTEAINSIPPISSMNVYASELGRLGGLKGGKARAKKLSKVQRVKIAKAGARARWAKKI